MTLSIFRHDGLALRYRDAGVGLPVIFQHGLGGDEAQVADVFPDVAGVRRVTLECRGQGGSPFGGRDGLAIATFETDLDALAVDLHLGGAVVGGISMGAAIAQRSAILRPEKVRALILARPAWIAAPAPDNMRPYGFVGNLMQRLAPDDARRRFEESAIAEELGRLAPDNLASLRGFFDRHDPKTFGALLSAIAADGPGVTETDLRSIDIPVLVIGHGQDLAHPEATAQRLADLIPHARYVAITPKAADRSAYRRDFQAALADFLKRLA